MHWFLTCQYKIQMIFKVFFSFQPRIFYHRTSAFEESKNVSESRIIDKLIYCLVFLTTAFLIFKHSFAMYDCPKFGIIDKAPKLAPLQVMISLWFLFPQDPPFNPDLCIRKRQWAPRHVRLYQNVLEAFYFTIQLCLAGLTTAEWMLLVQSLAYLRSGVENL